MNSYSFHNKSYHIPTPKSHPGADAMVDAKRVAPDGVAYTKEQFILHFGGTTEWDQATPEERRALGTPEPSEPPLSPTGAACGAWIGLWVWVFG